jgi:hypothetical protein
MFAPDKNEAEPYMNRQFISIAFTQAPQEARETSSPNAGQRPSSVRPSGPAVSPEQASAVPGADQYQPPVPTTPSYEHRAYMDHSLAKSVNYPCPDHLVYQVAASTTMDSPGGVYPEEQAPGGSSLMGEHSSFKSSPPREQHPYLESKTILATGLGDRASIDEIKTWIRKRCVKYALRDIRVPHKGSKLRGKAFVDFDTKEHALDAVKMLHRSIFRGRKVAAKVVIDCLPENVKRNRSKWPKMQRTYPTMQRTYPKMQSTYKDQDSDMGMKGQYFFVLPKRPGIRALSDAGPEAREEEEDDDDDYDDDDDLETQGHMEGEADEGKVAPKMVRRNSY